MPHIDSIESDRCDLVDGHIESQPIDSGQTTSEERRLGQHCRVNSTDSSRRLRIESARTADGRVAAVDDRLQRSVDHELPALGTGLWCCVGLQRHRQSSLSKSANPASEDSDSLLATVRNET